MFHPSVVELLSLQVLTYDANAAVFVEFMPKQLNIETMINVSALNEE